LSEQNANLDIARGMGLSNAAIQMLGLGDAANAQQLARLIQDMMKDPALVEALNSSIKERTDATTALITDQASLQWEEMRREYGLSMERAAEDFNRMREQQAKDFMTGLNDQRTEYNIQLEQSLADYNRMRNQQQSDFQRGLADQASDYLLQLEESRQDWNLARSEQLADFLKQNDRMYDEMDRQQKRATDDFSRNAEEIVASNEELAELAIAALTGTAKTQYEELNKILFGVGEEVKTNVSDLAKHVVEVADQLGLTGIFINFKGGSGGGSSGRMQYKAEGGTIDGYSPHDKADNIVIKATAGEYMQPVKAVQHYG